MMPKPLFEEAIQFAFNQLATRLPADLTYHNLWHSQVGVTTAVSCYAEIEGLSTLDTLLLRVAAAYHDIGFIDTITNHEEMGATCVRQTLPRFGFDEGQISKIIGMIMATKLPQSPRTLQEEIMADADLDVLGRDDFFERNEALRLELGWYQRPYTQTEWYEYQLDFLTHHTYFTQAAKQTRQKGKEANIQALRSLLSIDN